jgi:hypothetical protein
MDVSFLAIPQQRVLNQNYPTQVRPKVEANYSVDFRNLSEQSQNLCLRAADAKRSFPINRSSWSFFDQPGRSSIGEQESGKRNDVARRLCGRQ